MMADDTTFEGWAIVELMGHRRLAGFVTERQIAGVGMLAIEIPDVTTQFYSMAAVYCLTPTTEDVARKVAARSRPAPVQPWELPKELAAVRENDDDDDDDDPEWQSHDEYGDGRL